MSFMQIAINTWGKLILEIPPRSGLQLSSFLDKINQHSDMSTRQLILSPRILDLKLDKV